VGKEIINKTNGNDVAQTSTRERGCSPSLGWRADRPCREVVPELSCEGPEEVLT
jgi:hypothetical protein